jgi:hypothetical protein
VEVIHIDLPIFHSPTGAFGYFSGEIEVSHLPHADEPFPWPEPWLSNHEALFKEQSKQVWGITPWEWPPAKQHVTMFGIVCSGREEAGLLSKHIEQVSGILFSEYESAAEPGDA